jgi:DNA-directed RNA polymerase subunit RPC12/RpoP
MLTTTLCRHCKKLRSCLETNIVSNYRYLCKECAREENLVSECRSCGREGIYSELEKHGWYCHLCENDNIIECNLCGNEVYKTYAFNGICKKCINGKNKECIKCGNYFNKEKLTSDNLCPKCSIKIHKRLRSSQVNEIVECLECGREVLVNDLNNGLCIYCYAGELESEIKKFKKKKAYY